MTKREPAIRNQRWTAYSLSAYACSYYSIVETTMFEVSFKIQHDCPYTRFSMKHPDIRIVEWCNNKVHVMEIECPDIETFAGIEGDLNDLLVWKGGKILKKSFLKGDLQVILKTCRCGKISPNVSDIIERNSALLMEPEVYYGGWEEYTVIGFRDGDYKKLFEELGELGPVQILKKQIANEKSLRRHVRNFSQQRLLGAHRETAQLTDGGVGLRLL